MGRALGVSAPDPVGPNLPRTAAKSILLNAGGSNGDKVIITYLNPLLSLIIMVQKCPLNYKTKL